MVLVCISFSQLGIQLVFESIHFHDSCHFFETFKECIVHCLIVLHLVKSMLPSLWSCHLMVKMETVLRVYTYSQNKFLCQLFLIQSYGYIILKFHNFVPSFMSSMWDSSWPSFNKTIPVDISSSSRN